MHQVLLIANIENRAVTSMDVLSAVTVVDGVTTIVTGIGNRAMEELLKPEDLEWATPEPFDAVSMVAALRVRAIVISGGGSDPDGWAPIPDQLNGEEK